MKFPKPARWALGILLVFAALKGGCEIAEEVVEHWWMKGDPGTPTSAAQRVTHEVGRSSHAYSGDPAQKALTYLKENAGRLGLKPNLDDLKVTDARANRFGDNVELQQVYKGLPVENARIQVNFDKAGFVVQLVNSYTAPLNALERITHSKEQAVNQARQEFSRTTPTYVEVEGTARTVLTDPKDIQLSEATKVEDVYFAQQKQLRRAYMTYIHASKPFGVKQIVTDANNGNVLQVRNFVYDAVDGRGQVLTNDALPGASPTPFTTVSLPELDAPSGGPFVLKGPYVVLEDIELPKNTVPKNDTVPEFLKSQELADVMVYYHIDSMQRYIQAAPLGFPNIMNRQIRADAHGLGGAEDSRYVSSPDPLRQGYVAFGGGAVDDAEDPDVIAHEYGHAIQDNQTLGKYEIDSVETRAMSEGFADYWAFSTSSAFRKATDSTVNDPCCLMEWDHTTCFRFIDEFKTKDELSPDKTAHQNSLVWSATLVDIFHQLPDRQTADRIILQSHFNVPLGPTFELAADSIITADWQLFQGANRPVLCMVFQRHNIYAENHCPVMTHTL